MAATRGVMARVTAGRRANIASSYVTGDTWTEQTVCMMVSFVCFA